MDTQVMDAIKSMRKVELHRHLEGSIRFSTLMELAPASVKGNDPTAVERNVRKHYCITEPVKDLTECMDRFVHLQEFFQTEAVIERVAYEVCEDCYAEGTVVLEIRYSPTYIQAGRTDITPEGIHKAVLRGVERARAAFPMAVGLIGIIDRFMSFEEGDKAVQFIIDNKDTFLGIDMANDESKFPASKFTPLFVRAKEAGLRVTIHSGEVPCDEAPGWVKEAVEELGAERIGHGLHVMRDPEVVKAMVSKGIVFESCPSSNWLVASVPSLEEHPVASMVRAGLKVCLNTDDPGLFDIDFNNELYRAIKKCGLTLDEVRASMQVAYEASFIPEEEKSRFWQ